MKKEIKTGGPAFPSIAEYIQNDGYRALDGMTLRDYFAAKAMQGILSNPVYFAALQDQAIELDKFKQVTTVFQLISELSSDMADSMLEIRK